MPNPHNPAERCDGCRFYSPESDKKGKCHRLPPVPVFDGTPKTPSVFPEVLPTAWCGEWQPIPPAPPPPPTGKDAIPRVYGGGS
jgi:hypothetical protein